MIDKTDAVQLRSTKRSLPIALLRARETLMAPVREMLSQSQISEQKWRVLRVIHEDGPLEQTTIAERACLLLPSLTRILRAMEQDGFVSRVPGETDRRKSVVTITPQGMEIIQRHASESNALFERLEREFGPQDWDTLLELLNRLRKMDV
ncbi:homoprotocatechuate degradation operon regulator, HpaR [Amylibacter marinus]|uniref:Homoprotocatechuate degradation operon regulator, HpaR n=1 Tax=Amylibacter marinus TaxID=1475483 RepID=A0ABQ5VX43_9RHOB|nr:homoprotocatechuate degradation operon regulator HpaR [Amylibacter marinus]GLQ35830.1 homoprotocatechuate degradation operon regulator, HpaR [Amylibacter marinus]